MNESQKEFGGWLRVFYYLTLLSLVSNTLYTVLGALGSGWLILGVALGKKVISDVIPVFMGFVIVAPFAYVNFQIYRPLEERSPAIPARIVKLLSIRILLSILAVLCAFLVTKFQSSEGSSPRSVVVLLLEILGISLTWLWILYFQRSKRVKAFYGANAPVSGHA